MRYLWYLRYMPTCTNSSNVLYGRREADYPDPGADEFQNLVSSSPDWYTCSVWSWWRLLLNCDLCSVNRQTDGQTQLTYYSRISASNKRRVLHNVLYGRNKITRAVRNRIRPPRRIWSGSGVRIRIRTPDISTWLFRKFNGVFIVQGYNVW